MVAEGYKETKIGSIPVEWEVVKIVEVLDLMTDYVANGSFASLRENTTVYEDKEYAYYVRLFDLRRGLGHNAQKYVDEATYNFLDKSFLEGNEILIANIGANVGESFLMPTLNISATLAPNMIELKLNYEKMTPLFCLNYLKSGIGLAELDKVIEGSGQPKINKTKLKTIRIPLPPLKEQEKIADILSTADEKIDAIASQIEMCETLKKGLLQKLLSEGIGHSEFKDSELGKIPESWEVVKIGDIVSVAVGRDLKENNFSKQQNSEYKYPVFSNTVDNNGLYGFYNFEEYRGESLTVVGRGIGVGTAFTKNGSYGAIGRLIVLFPNKNLFPHYLTEYINFRINIFSESSGIPQLTGQAITKYKCVLPPLKEQKQIADILSTADEKLEVLRAKKEKYETLKKGLLQKLLSGEVRVSYLT